MIEFTLIGSSMAEESRLKMIMDLLKKSANHLKYKFFYNKEHLRLFLSLIKFIAVDLERLRFVEIVQPDILLKILVLLFLFGTI